MSILSFLALSALQVKLLLVIFIMLGSIAASALVLLLRKMLNDQINHQLTNKIPKGLRRFVGFRIKWR